MRDAMAAAEVGDDVLGEDPTVLALQEEAAALFGKPAALFVPSGTMGNQICLGVLTRPGSEVIAEASSHILINEVGSASRLWGVQIQTIPGERGVMDPDDVARLVRTPDVHHPESALLSIENTHNYAGGFPQPLENLDALAAVARHHGLRVHMDGARVMNAAVATGETPARIVRDVDMVSVCLSKGLGAPVGSLVIGEAKEMTAAHRLRKALGGGMRQVGMLAAAALIALREGPGLMVEDHRRTLALAKHVAELPGLHVDLESVQTNILFVTVPGRGEAIQHELADRGVGSFALDEDRVRLVFHREAGDDALAAACQAFSEIAAG